MSREIFIHLPDGQIVKAAVHSWESEGDVRNRILSSAHAESKIKNRVSAQHTGATFGEKLKAVFGLPVNGPNKEPIKQIADHVERHPDKTVVVGIGKSPKTGKKFEVGYVDDRFNENRVILGINEDSGQVRSFNNDTSLDAHELTDEALGISSGWTGYFDPVRANTDETAQVRMNEMRALKKLPPLSESDFEKRAQEAEHKRTHEPEESRLGNNAQEQANLRHIMGDDW